MRAREYVEVLTAAAVCAAVLVFAPVLNALWVLVAFGSFAGTAFGLAYVIDKLTTASRDIDTILARVQRESDERRAADAAVFDTVRQGRADW